MPITDTIAQRLDDARRRRFVGRSEECEAFRSALRQGEESPAVIYIHGPGGIGKSSLLDRFSQIAFESRRTVVRFDARNVDTSSQSLQRALDSAIDVTSKDSAPERSSLILMIDTFELLENLDDWIRESLLPSLPAQTQVVLAGRQPPSTGWRSDSGLSSLTLELPLRNLRWEDVANYVAGRGVDHIHAETVSVLSHGHPLAMSLIVDLIEHSHTVPTHLDQHPEMLSLLIRTLVSETLDDQQRDAISVCAHARSTTESDLREALELSDAKALFDWLRGRTFIYEGPDGLFPHDLARDALEAEFRWRDPARYAQMHKRVRAPIIDRIRRSVSPGERQKATFDLLFLHRNNPVIGGILDFASFGNASSRPSSDDDLPALLAALDRYEGPESARIAAYWFDQQPEAFMTFVSPDGAPLGFLAALDLCSMTETDRAVDPIADQTLRFVESSEPLRAGERALHYRFTLDVDHYQARSPGMAMTAMRTTLDWLSTEGLAWTFMTIGMPEEWKPVMHALHFELLGETTMESGPFQQVIFGHDWRKEPLEQWLDQMEKREIDHTFDPAVAIVPEPIVVLSRQEFDRAVKDALKHLHRPDTLKKNPLCRSKCVTHAGKPDEPSFTLRELILNAAADLANSPRDAKLWRALDLTYLEPIGTQELVAERLDLPFNTYRYHLAGAQRRVADYLWNKETG